MNSLGSVNLDTLAMGLEVSVVSLSTLKEAADTHRLDSEYFSRTFLADDARLKLKSERFQTVEDLPVALDASAFYPSIEPQYGLGSLPFLRVADVNGFIDPSTATTIPAELCDKFPTLNRVSAGDILFTKGGAIDRVGLVTTDAAVSRDLISLNSSALGQHDQKFLFAYFQTGLFKRALVRSSSQTAQPHLTLRLVRKLPVLKASDELKASVATLVDASFEAATASKALFSQAEIDLVEAVGLMGWSPPEPLAYVRPSAEVLEAGRLDAEHYQQRFYAARAALTDAGAIRFVPLGSLLSELTNGQTPLRHDLSQGDVTFLAGEHVRDFEILLSSKKRVERSHHNGLLRRTKLSVGDVLLTIKGRVGDAALVEELDGPTNINQDVALLRFKDELPVWYVLAFINCAFGRLAVDQLVTGAINPFFGLENVRRLPIPIFDDQLMTNVAELTRQHVQTAKAQKKRALSLLAAAKAAIEVAIEDSDEAAVSFAQKEVADAATA